MKIKFSVIAIAATMLLTGCSGDNQQAEKTEEKSKETTSQIINNNNSTNMENLDYAKQYTGAVLKTSMGDIKVKFYNEATPVTVNNFLKLAQENFYDGVKFHRVIKGFMIQGGDPNSKTDAVNTWGVGGPGYKFADELTGKEKYPQGTVAMANSGPDTNGSQFFIVTASPAAPLPPSYTVFGEVIAGMENALKIENVKTTVNDRPVEAVIIKSVDLVK